jgi:hypothetical protein
MKAKDGIQSPPPPKITRFPRLPMETNMKELARKAWAAPKFTATEVNGVTNFVFSVPLRDKIRSYNKHLYHSLFKSRGPVWKTALEEAYPSAISGKKTVADYMDKKLYIVFRDALKVMMAHAKTIAKNYEGMTGKGEGYRARFEQNVEKQIKAFVSKSSRKGRQRIHQLDDTRAIRLAQRFKTLEPLVLGLKSFVDNLKIKGHQDEAALLAEVRKNYQGRAWIAHVLDAQAFRALQPNSDGVLPARLTLWGEWDPHDLVIGIIICEERSHLGRPILASTIKKIIDRGMELI